MGDFFEDAPALIGDEFPGEWAHWTVGELFEFLTTEMPPKDKDQRDITPENHADILAFLLKKNGFPAGSMEWPADINPSIEIEMRSGSVDVDLHCDHASDRDIPSNGSGTGRTDHVTSWRRVNHPRKPGRV